MKATFLVDGTVAGTWTVEVKRKVATLTLAPFATLAKPAVEELEAEAVALLAFLTRNTFLGERFATPDELAKAAEELGLPRSAVVRPAA